MQRINKNSNFNQINLSDLARKLHSLNNGQVLTFNTGSRILLVLHKFSKLEQTTLEKKEKWIHG